MPHVASKVVYWYVSLLETSAEVVLKVKTKWGKHILIEDQYSRTEKFHPWERADRRVRITTRRKRMPRCTQDPDSNNYDTKGDSVESTDSGTYMPTGKGFGYPPLIFTDPEHAANIPDSDTMDSMTEILQLSSYVRDYCEECVTKWSRSICRPESD